MRVSKKNKPLMPAPFAVCLSAVLAETSQVAGVAEKAAWLPSSPASKMGQAEQGRAGQRWPAGPASHSDRSIFLRAVN